MNEFRRLMRAVFEGIHRARSTRAELREETDPLRIQELEAVALEREMEAIIACYQLVAAHRDLTGAVWDEEPAAVRAEPINDGTGTVFYRGDMELGVMQTEADPAAPDGWSADDGR